MEIKMAGWNNELKKEKKKEKWETKVKNKKHNWKKYQ